MPHATLPVDALLLDLDGTLYQDGAPISGSLEAVTRLVEIGVPRRYITNTTRVSRRALTERLRAMGFPADEDEIYTAPVAAATWLRSEGITRVALHLPDATREDFAGLDVVATRPEAIVVGDLGNEWTYERLNSAFRQILDGARLVALQKNRYWRTDDGLTLDAGPFVAALEYATQAKAVVVGKPSGAFFRLAAEALDTPVDRIAVVGDDVESDVGGGQAAGLRGALVRTGKFRPDALVNSALRPDWVADSFARLVDSWLP